MQNFEDQLLVQQVADSKDHAAFAVLYSRYQKKIHDFLLFKLARKEDIEDISSQIFLKLWEYLIDGNKRQIHNLRAFLYKSARNAVANFYRAQGHMPKPVELDDPDEYLEISDGREDTLIKLLKSQSIDELTACVQQIPESYREIIALRFFEELEINEIAEITGKTIGNTNVLIHRGVQSLRKIMLPKMEQYDNQGI
ncbi:hypothetical protein A3B21_04735 [Candidatus Uhrbacteria bacterium RIFCSPLOWO2_01_FULL_47_24]|uniref:RNA polymerase sigma factor 70 region 4 type 2 domain-containing protein n=1 Tax=Candidatus Uhrbacteria bacterium RIFCSPLOWO2_01_FULL_47_24 TaxID=1802401 RepID=A0A1F7UTY4_9BACT|nr:MAG: hypothetical protein A2753_01925 [Candidatus Uhrbacteria bacterium RIFCSPHIGHO2_01_FULL_47_11]OGL75931.1 MAG: hypothetical protein A3F52_02620 [Candidatus Uhrbacteria bacterium RIFCSPHIGHO2_12_FULL_47_11]OGL81725.1 MAG: hypothetical protein A3B21_04735 [Candidatus Uhrbacteria bacterium RIFCSPLOWO2_01_FULL_47_24]OGL85022.1 MAG: hypothetical protein A3J03_03585 [Candidatus Uhrbacteria bacterium RIFCSPLOWO2_02_FULL_46_25]OGL91745.1 MAG: hypothetical protein A3H11_01235 [Candidatus Uhrbacte